CLVEGHAQLETIVHHVQHLARRQRDFRANAIARANQYFSAHVTVRNQNELNSHGARCCQPASKDLMAWASCSVRPISSRPLTRQYLLNSPTSNASSSPSGVRTVCAGRSTVS